jgi:hypothetical protein
LPAQYAEELSASRTELVFLHCSAAPPASLPSHTGGLCFNTLPIEDIDCRTGTGHWPLPKSSGVLAELRTQLIVKSLRAKEESPRARRKRGLSSLIPASYIMDFGRDSGVTRQRCTPSRDCPHHNLCGCRAKRIKQGIPRRCRRLGTNDVKFIQRRIHNTSDFVRNVFSARYSPVRQQTRQIQNATQNTLAKGA